MKLIDADEAVHIAERVFCDDCYYNGVKCNACPIDGMIKLIDNTKAVDAVPVVHGHWTMNENEREIEEYKCSACKRNVWLSYGDTACDYKYCPNCGAKMDGKDSDKNGQDLL